MIHDARVSDIGQESYINGLTHSQELALHLERLISSEEEIDYCIDVEKNIWDLKYSFYDQFLVTTNQ